MLATRIPEDLHARVIVFANETGATLSAAVRELLTRGLAAEANPVTPKKAGPNPAGATRAKDQKPVASSPASSRDVLPNFKQGKK